MGMPGSVLRCIDGEEKMLGMSMMEGEGERTMARFSIFVERIIMSDEICIFVAELSCVYVYCQI